MNGSTARRTVVTGVGVVAPNGIGADVFWKATREGRFVLDRISREGCDHLPLTVAGEVRDFDPAAVVEERYLVQTDRFTHFALVAADQALADAALGPTSTFGVGVTTASCSGGGEFGQRELQNLWGKGPGFVGPYQSIAWFYAATTGQISIRGGFKGPCAVLANDEAGGLDALAHAVRTIRRGTDAVVVGAAEAPLAPYSMVCQLGYDALSLAADPARAYLPFTSAARGFAPAEGGAMFVVEEAESARRRGARIRAEVLGHGATFTGTCGWGPSRHGLARAIRDALAEAECGPADIDVVFADALGTPRPTTPKYSPCPTRWAPAPPGCRSPRPRPASAGPTAAHRCSTAPPRSWPWNTAYCRPPRACSTSATTSTWSPAGPGPPNCAPPWCSAAA